MKNKKKTIKIIIGILVVALIVGVYALSSAKPKEYRTYEVKKGNIKTVVSGSGTIGAKKSRKEYSKISAEITDIFFNEGDEVKAGDVIEIDEKHKNSQRMKDVVEVAGGRLVPEWLDVDTEKLQGTVKELPTREQIDVPVDEMLIVELYSK